MSKCSFCGQSIPQGRGITYVEVSGRIYNFCSSKCKKNRKLGRDHKKVKWIIKRKE